LSYIVSVRKLEKTDSPQAEAIGETKRSDLMNAAEKKQYVNNQKIIGETKRSDS